MTRKKKLRTITRSCWITCSPAGTLIVQYNASAADFNKGNFTPYHAQISRARVTVEEAPVEILAPGDGVFHFPNEITARDFDGWVQERGLVFHGPVGRARSRRFCRAMIRESRSRRVDCCGLSMERARTFTRDMRFSGSCRLGCRERFGFM